ncbi:MAG: ABC transporter permease subunit [Candidatus Symbiothrix sp.]|jgi:phosphate transport system permease protein|nr:ABC transporter permease subunit [Candidatus Symbiothrix sp.]
MNKLKSHRTAVDRIVFGLIILCAILALIPLIWLIFDLFIKGYKQINFDFFTQVSPTPLEAYLSHLGKQIIPGGILNGISGSFLVIVIATVIAVPLGILGGLFMYDNHSPRFSSFFHYSIFSLLGIPPVITGIVVYLWIVEPLHGFSALAGGISLAIVMLPMIIYTTFKALETLPRNIKEDGAVLGGTYTSIIFRIVLPTVRDKIISGILVAISRAVGVTSPLIITALGAPEINWNIDHPVSTISVLIWNFFNNSDMVNMVWTTTLFLFLTVIVLNIIAKGIYYGQKLHT